MVDEVIPEKDILIAEDDKDDVEIFQLAMKELGIDYQLRHAENGSMLMIMLKENIPYILFLDINMPCKDGISCIIEIRKNREYDNLPIIIYSGNRLESVAENCYRNGANLYLTKSSIFTSIVENLRKIFAIDWNNYMPYPSFQKFVLS